MFSLKTYNIGIDIGTYRTKLVCLNLKRHDYTYDIFDTPKDCIYNGYIKNKKDIAEIIRSRLDKKKTKGKLCFTVSSSDIITREIRMPYMKESELKEAVKYEAQNYIPTDLDDHIVDYKIVQTLNTKDDSSPNDASSGEASPGLKVLFVASPQNLINGYVELSQDINMPLKAIDIIPNCTLKAAKFFNINDTGPIAILDIGKASSNLLILNGGMYAFHRDIAFGGDNITGYLSQSMDIAIEEAEKIKISGSYDDNISDIVYDELLRDIDAVFNYFSSHSRSYVKKLYLTGGSSDKALSDIIKKYFNIDTVILDSEKKNLLPALGAAVREG